MLGLFSLLTYIFCFGEEERSDVIITLARDSSVKLTSDDSNMLIAKKSSILSKLNPGFGPEEGIATLVVKLGNKVQIYYKGRPLAASDSDDKLRVGMTSDFDPKTFFEMVQSPEGVKFVYNGMCIDASNIDNALEQNFVKLVPCSTSPYQLFDAKPANIPGSILSGIGARLSGLAGRAGFSSSYRYSSSSSSRSRNSI